jgi:hypothetical protein
MVYKKLDKMAEKRSTWIALTVFLFFVMCFSWILDARGYFFRLWNGTLIRIENVEIEIPADYYIDKVEKGVYTISDVRDHNIQLYIEGWNGDPTLDKAAQNVEKIGGVVRTYELYGQSIHEFFVRSDKWKNNLGAVIYVFPKQKVKITYAGPTFMMYRTMNEFARNFKDIQ